MNTTSLPADRPVVANGPRSQEAGTADSTAYDMIRAVLASDLTSGQARVLLAILDHAGHGQSCCYAVNETLADDCHLGCQHVRKEIRALEAGGWIIVQRATASIHSRRTIFVGPRLVGEVITRKAKIEAIRKAKRTRVHPVPEAQPTVATKRVPGAQLRGYQGRNQEGTTGATKRVPEAQQTSSLTDPSTSSFERGAKSDDDGVSLPGGEKTPEPTPKPEARPKEIPSEFVEAFRVACGNECAEEVARSQAQFLADAGWNLATVQGAFKATILDVRKVAKTRRPIGNPVGYFDTKCREFAREGVPEAYQGDLPSPPAPKPQPVPYVARTETAEEIQRQKDELARFNAEGGFRAMAARLAQGHQADKAIPVPKSIPDRPKSGRAWLLRGVSTPIGCQAAM
jgi:DNA-binding MarR family transcriptional regulator